MSISYSVEGDKELFIDVTWPEIEGNLFRLKDQGGQFVVYKTDKPIQDWVADPTPYRVYLTTKTTKKECKAYNKNHKVSLSRFTTEPLDAFDLFRDIAVSLQNIATLTTIEVQLREERRLGGLSGLLDRISHGQLVQNPSNQQNSRFTTSVEAWKPLLPKVDDKTTTPEIHVERYGTMRPSAGGSRVIWIVDNPKQLSAARQAMLKAASHQAFVLRGVEVRGNKEMMGCIEDGIDSLNALDVSQACHLPSPHKPITELLKEFQRTTEALGLTKPETLNSAIAQL